MKQGGRKEGERKEERDWEIPTLEEKQEPAEQLAGGSLPNSCNSLWILFKAMIYYIYYFHRKQAYLV